MSISFGTLHRKYRLYCLFIFSLSLLRALLAILNVERFLLSDGTRVTLIPKTFLFFLPKPYQVPLSTGIHWTHLWSKATALCWQSMRESWRMLREKWKIPLQVTLLALSGSPFNSQRHTHWHTYTHKQPILTYTPLPRFLHTHTYTRKHIHSYDIKPPKYHHSLPQY